MAATTTQMQPATDTPKPKTLKDWLSGKEVTDRLASVASQYVRPEAIVRMALLAVSRNPDLAKCTQQSILRCLMDAAALGIEPGGLMGRGFLVPRYNKQIEATEMHFDPGWRGLADIAKRSGAVKRIHSAVVHERDQCEVIYGDEPSIRHKPYDGQDDPGPIVGAYAVAKFDDGERQFEYLTARDLAKIQAVSASKAGPWAEWPDEMARKSAVRRLCKSLPYNETLELAQEVATRAEMPAMPQLGAAPAAPDSKTKSLADKLREEPENGESP